MSRAQAQREQLLARLRRLSADRPVLSGELARSRRRAATLLVEKRGLLEEVRRTRARSANFTHARPAGPAGSGLRVAAPR